MALTQEQVTVGAIVDHCFEVMDARTGATKQRPVIRRGIIVRIEEVPQTRVDGSSRSPRRELYVQFAPDPAQPETVDASELVFVSWPRPAPKGEKTPLYGTRSGVENRPLSEIRREDQLGLTRSAGPLVEDTRNDQ